MFQKFPDEHDQHPDILDRAAFARPQANSWNWRLTVLVGFLILLSVLLLFSAYHDLTSNAINYYMQIRLTWISIGVGFMALMSAFLLRRRSPIGWLLTITLISTIVVIVAVFLGNLLLLLYQSDISLSDFPLVLFLEIGLLIFMSYTLYLLSHSAVRQIFGTPLTWFWVFLASGGIMGAVAGGWLVS